MEAAIVLPILILVILSLLTVMLHDRDGHQAQIDLHNQLISTWNLDTAGFDIKKKKIETSSKISGAVHLWIHDEKICRSYMLSPAAYIRLGEMMSFDDNK